MSYVELQTKDVRVRKPHRCIWCGEHIPKGDTAVYRSYVFDNALQSDWMHQECYEAMGTPGVDCLDDEGGFDPYSYRRGSAELRVREFKA